MKPRELLKMLEGGDRRSTGRSEEAAAEVLANPPLFKELIRGMQSSDPLIRMRSADAAEKVTVHNPILLEPHKKVILNKVARIPQQEIRWHVAQFISRIQWNTKERQAILTLLDEYLQDKSSIVRTFSMQAMADIASQDAKLRKSITKKLEHLTESGTPAMKSRGKKLLLRFQKQK